MPELFKRDCPVEGLRLKHLEETMNYLGEKAFLEELRIEKIENLQDAHLHATILQENRLMWEHNGTCL